MNIWKDPHTGLRWPSDIGSDDTYIDIVFDGPPGPVAGRFVEVEDSQRKSIKVGEWLERDDGYWVLRLTQHDEKNDE